MPTRVLCKTKTGKIRKKLKSGKCPKGTTQKRIRVKKSRRSRSTKSRTRKSRKSRSTRSRTRRSRKR